MSIEKEIRKYLRLANDERSRRIMIQKTRPSNTNAELTTFEAEYRQIASWLQELKERREKESRQIIPQDMTEEACEAMIKLIEKIIEFLPDIIESVTANMPEAIEQYIEAKIRNGKEESK